MESNINFAKLCPAIDPNLTRQATVVQIVLVQQLVLLGPTRDTMLNRLSPAPTMVLHGETHSPRSGRQEEKNQVHMMLFPMAKKPLWPVFRFPPLKLSPQMHLGAFHTILVTTGLHLPQ